MDVWCGRDHVCQILAEWEQQDEACGRKLPHTREQRDPYSDQTLTEASRRKLRQATAAL
jgi:hypothetical protein